MPLHSITEHPLGEPLRYEKYAVGLWQEKRPRSQWCRLQSPTLVNLGLVMASQSPPATCERHTNIKLSMTFFERGNYIADI